MDANSLSQALHLLKELLKEGTLSKEEYQEEKQLLLDQFRGLIILNSEDVGKEEQVRAEKDSSLDQEKSSKEAQLFVSKEDIQEQFMTGGLNKSLETPNVSVLDDESISKEINYGEPPMVLGTNEHLSRGGYFEKGEVLRGRYEIRKLLGEGAMGVVYLVFDRVRQKEIALKQVHHHLADNQEMRRRFMRELEINEVLSHRGIIRTYTVDEDHDKNCFFFTMKYIKGDSLEKLLQEREEKNHLPPLPIEKSLKILGMLCEILHYAHSEGVIHRDVKPSNIIIDKDGLPQLMDFGIAKLLNDGEHHQKNTGFLGTVYYMAPEQLKGREVTARADIYSLGILTYRMFTSELYQGGMPGPSELVPALPKSLDAVIQKATYWKPKQRYSTALEFFDALKSVFSDESERSLEVATIDAKKEKKLSKFSKRKKSSIKREKDEKTQVKQDDIIPTGELIETLKANYYQTNEHYQVVSQLLEGFKGVELSNDALDSPKITKELSQFKKLLEIASGSFNSTKEARFIQEGERLGMQEVEIIDMIAILKEQQMKKDDFQPNIEGKAELLFAFHSHDDWLTDCAYSSGGSWVASASWDGTVHIRQNSTGQLKEILSGSDDKIESCSFAPNGKSLGTVTADGMIRVWNLKDGTLGKFWDTKLSLAGGSFVPNGKHIISFARDGQIQLWNASSGRVLRTFSGHETTINDLQVSNEELFISCAEDGSLKVWKFGAKKPICSFPRYQEPLISCTPFLKGHIILTSSTDGTLQVWDTKKEELHSRLEGHDSPVRCCAISNGGKLFLSGDDNGYIKLWNAYDGTCLVSAQLTPKAISACAFDPNQRRFITAHHDGIIAFWKFS